MKYLAVGDQHIGAGADLGLKPGERLAEQEAVWEWTLQQAREHEVDAILHAGDVFQHRRPDPEALLAFERPLVKHRALNGPRVLLISGNHDLSSLDTGCALDVFAEAGLVDLARTPRVVLVEGGCLLACLPWAPTSRLAAAFDGPRDELNEHAATLLIDAARDLYAHAEDRARFGPGQTKQPIVLLTHFHVTGTTLPPVKLGEPVLPGDELLSIGYDAVIVGHLHVPEIFGGTGLSVGSPQPLNFGEADGRLRGVWLVTFDAGVQYQLLRSPARRFVNIDNADGFTAADVDQAFVKFRIRGSEAEVHAVDVDVVKDTLTALGAHRVLVDLQVEREARARDASVDDSISEHEALTKWLAAQNGRVDHDVAARALQRAAGYFEQVSG